MADKVRFTPVMGSDEKIQLLPRTDGRVYFATDTRKIYLDTDKDNKLPVGGAGNSGIYYGKKENISDADKESGRTTFILNTDIEGEELPSMDDLILNSDGSFYRVISVDINNQSVIGFRLTVAGGGGGGGVSTIVRPALTLHEIDNPIIINGQPFEISFTAKAALDENDTPLTSKLTIYWSLIDADNGQVYYTGIPVSANHDEVTKLNVGSYLKESTSTTIELYATGINHDQPSVTRQASVSTVEMYLEQTSSYDPSYRYGAGKTVLSCNAIGKLSKILEWTFDGKMLYSEVLASNATNPRDFAVPAEYATHGYHVVEVNLYQNLGDNNNPIKGLPATPLKYEIAVVEEGNSKALPIIWLGDYQEEYYNYDTIQIPFLVYNPANTAQAEVHLYRNDIEIDGSPRTIKDFSEFTYWQIADAELNKENYYSISCGLTPETSAVREVKFRVVPDPVRKMEIVKQNNLKLNFDPAGRSNSEPTAKRQSWTYGEGDNKISATFDNFNWYNNGWYTDSETKNTFLRISNGAKFTIPFGALEFGTSDTSKQSNSIELAFKVRNIQNYANLITNITRYKNDENWYKAFTDPSQKQHSNYDAYLQATLTPSEYENLEFDKVQKNINLKNAVCGFYSGDDKSAVGICVGSQDTFFSNGKDTVNVNFVENEMVYLSFVYDHSLKLMFIYINGAITGVIESSVSGESGFKINANNIVFNSETCDIDLYKIRIYNTTLSVNDIVTNHAVDKKDIVIYDQNGLAVENTTLKEYQLNFDKILDYNKEHPEEPLMPYIVFDTTTTSDDKLPYAKANGTTKIRVEFVNVPLDTAYARGELIQKCVDDGLLSATEVDQNVINEAVKTYYKHHCPSWTSTMSANDVVTIEVQGTSSEFYPRRNFKVKTKYKKENTWGEIEDESGNKVPGWEEDECLNIFMDKGPFEQVFKNDQKKLKEDNHYYGVEESRLSKGWYMNNYTNPTDRWTMKVDYMESSGSYNAGFASMIGNAYTKHPLEDYVKAGVLDKTSEFNNKVFGDTRWEDYRTSLLGFPVMAFQKRKKLGSTSGETEHLFIGYYRMLLDKGSDQVLGFKPSKKVTHKLVGNKMLRDVAECWEFSTNARTFCSYRDPWDRVELSFKAPASEGLNGFIKLEGGKIGGPVVLNHFEPRYFKYKDYLANDEDGFYNFGNLDQDTANEICEDIGIDVIDTTSENAPYLAQDAAVNLMGNWEKVCKWVYSTNIDNVKSQGSYSEIPVGLVEYKPGEFYIEDETSPTGYSYATGEFDPDRTYYKETIYTEKDEQTQEEVEKRKYENAYATLNDYIYKMNKFYIYVSGAYSLCSDVEFDSSQTYYKFTSLENDEIAKIADLLVKPATEYDSNAIYYTYDSDAKVVSGGGKTTAVTEVGKLSEEQFLAGSYYIPAPKKYVNTEYHYDTKEYRTAKFVNELAQHFDPEYLATFFIATEVFECYDSRGKNCMMASWGPLKEGGDYIWYPIFYDIDTQLGINNTGIPSFEFNVDATEMGNYSTSDSLLWNNFYKFFKGSYILNKYKNLRSIASTFDNLENPPLQNVEYIEKWYKFDPEVTKNIADKGKRPLIATNLDMYWKYITITNPKAESQGVAYIPGADGVYDYDRDGTYFYALQGDRSQSRRQFLTNRIEYIDSWLNQKNYARGGNNRIRGRISANSVTSKITSDQWVETGSSPYWKDQEFGTKTHDFDAEYWLTLKPIRSSYVTAGDDSANYPSQKYDGVNSVKFKLSDIENGIRKSSNYPEQLVYIYGMNQMSDFGDMNKLYWTEFYMEGSANHLTRLQLGYDGYSRTDGIQWFNQKLNGIKLSEMPLLQEANFSKIGLQTETSLDLSASEKLENFRAVGTSKLVDVKFADGVALNTLYLPPSITSLKLVQANLLNNLIDLAVAPTPINEDDGSVTPPTPGLFLEGFFGSEFTSSIRNIHLDGGSLGYGSYKILKRFYDIMSANVEDDATKALTMTDVDWSPYKQLTEGAVYNKDETYYIDNKHYGFELWSKNASTFNDLVLNGQLYVYAGDPEVNIGDEFKEMFEVGLRNEVIFKDASSTQPNPIISGIIYINNTTPIEESHIRTVLQPMYPNLTFFFANVIKAYSAEFFYRNPETGIDEYVRFVNGSKEPSVQKIAQSDFTSGEKVWFDDPFALYKPERTHYDFKGWSTDVNAKPNDASVITNATDWNKLEINSTQFDYTYYAIFEIHKYDINFYDGDGSLLETKQVAYGTTSIPLPSKVPYKDDSNLDDYTTYKLKGYTDNTLTNKIVDLNSTTVRNNASYYPIFEEINVYDNFFYIDNIDTYFEFYDASYTESYSEGVPDWANTTGCSIKLKDGVVFRGKITLPVCNKEGVPVVRINSDGFKAQDKITHIYFQNKTPNGESCSNEIRSINDNAFRECYKLKIFEWPEKLRRLGEYAFYKCYNLTSTDVTSPLVYLDKYCFGYAFIPQSKNPNLLTIHLPNSIRNINNSAFLGYNNCSSASAGENKVLDKIYFGSEREILDYVIAFADARTFNATTINTAIIYCSDEHYGTWNSDTMREKFPSGTQFVFPCQEG